MALRNFHPVLIPSHLLTPGREIRVKGALTLLSLREVMLQKLF